MEILRTSKSGIATFVILISLFAAFLGVAIRFDGGKRAFAAAMPPNGIKELTWHFPTEQWGPTQVLVTVPLSATSQNPMPVLIALHGRGEAIRGPALGSRGFADDYGMLHAFSRLASPPLTTADFGDMITKARLRGFNAALNRQSYRGLIVVCPFLPDRFSPKKLPQDTKAYGEFLVNRLLPRVFKETPAMKTSASTGIDGVSLGGRAAINVGLTYPNTFGAVGGMQPAIGKKQKRRIVDLLKGARAKNSKIQFRLLGSDKDVFLKATKGLSHALNQSGQAHQVDIVKGNHSYQFNRGPGIYEMLLYYDRILRGEAFDVD